MYFLKYTFFFNLNILYVTCSKIIVSIIALGFTYFEFPDIYS